MSRRSSTPSVTLFPFLAVLVCTMGALILLLLVTTRRIRMQAEQAAVVASQAEEESRQAALEAQAKRRRQAELAEQKRKQAELDRKKKQAELAKQRDAERKARETEIAEKLKQHEESLASREREIEALRNKWKARYDELKRKQQEVAAALAAQRAEVEQTSKTFEQLKDEEQRLQQDLEQTDKHLEAALEAEEAKREELAALNRRIAENEKEIESDRLAQAFSRPKLEIVAFDGQSGTTRRPILIECREDGIVFPVEGVTLSAQQLDQFVPEYNPLMAGAGALFQYWQQKDSAGGRSAAKPYVLLIVRPKGTVAFYIARQFLDKLGEDSGYELVTERDDIQWPEADPEAVKVCRAAVEQVLKNPRGAASYRHMHRAFEDEHRVSSSDGRFRLSAVDRMRESPMQSLDPNRSFWIPPQRKTSEPANAGTGQFPPSGPDRDPYGSGTGRHAFDQVTAGTGRTPVMSTPPAEPFAPGAGVHSSPTTLEEAARELASGSAGGSIIPPGPDEVFSDDIANGTADQEVWNGTALKPAERNVHQQEIGRRSLPGLSEGTPDGGQGRALHDPSNQALAAAARELEARQGMPRKLMPSATAASQYGGQASESGAGGPGRMSWQQNAPSRGDESRGSATHWSNDGGENRQWGAAQNGGSIGIERDVKLHLYANRILLEDEEQIDVSEQMGRAELQQAVAAVLDEHARSWGPPPKSFSWRPSLEITIHPGGNQHYLRVKELFEHWGLTTRVEQVLN